MSPRDFRSKSRHTPFHYVSFSTKDANSDHLVFVSEDRLKAFNARSYSTCPICANLIVPKMICRVDPESRQTAHARCVSQEYEARNSEDAARIASFRQQVQSVACPRCSAPAGGPCRELGRPRTQVHRERVRVWRAIEARRDAAGD